MLCNSFNMEMPCCSDRTATISALLSLWQQILFTARRIFFFLVFLCVFLEQLEAVSSCGSFTPHFCICTGSGSVQQCSEILGWSLGNSAAVQCDECNWTVLSLARTQLYTKFRLWPSSLFSLLHSHHYLCHPTTVQGMSIWNPRTVMLLSQQSCAKESQSKTHSWLTQGSSTNSNILWQ